MKPSSDFLFYTFIFFTSFGKFRGNCLKPERAVWKNVTQTSDYTFEMLKNKIWGYRAEGGDLIVHAPLYICEEDSCIMGNEDSRLCWGWQMLQGCLLCLFSWLYYLKTSKSVKPVHRWSNSVESKVFFLNISSQAWVIRCLKVLKLLHFSTAWRYWHFIAVLLQMF